MGNYLLTYSGGSGEMPATEAEQAAVMEAWGAWYGTIGADLVDGGAPTGQAQSVAPDGLVSDGSATKLTGYTIISVDSLDQATAHAKGCPILAEGGTVDVYSTIDMS